MPSVVAGCRAGVAPPRSYTALRRCSHVVTTHPGRIRSHNVSTRNSITAEKAVAPATPVAAASPPESTPSTTPRPPGFDREKYKARHMIECRIGLLKQARGVATNDKLAVRYEASVQLALIRQSL